MSFYPGSFTTFCNLCENLRKNKKHIDQDKILSEFIKEFKILDKTHLPTSDTAKSSFYPALRLLVPEFDRQRGAYGFKETSFAKLLIRSFCLPTQDANKLTNYKSNTNPKKGDDFADVSYWILKKRCSNKNSLTIANVNEFLDTLALQHSEKKNIREIERTFYTVSKKLTALEIKWIIRLILKDMKLGIGNDRILRMFHQDAPDLYDNCSNLQKVCEDLNDATIRLHEINICVFTPFRPMLSLKCDLKVFDSEVRDQRVLYLENKFDGERFQLHMQNGEFKYFSKNGYDFSNTFGSTYDSTGVITPYLRESFGEIKSIILDGEMMGWNKRTRQFGSKGMNFDVKNLKDSSVHRPCFCVFDILLYNDRILTNEPLKSRLNILKNIIVNIEGVIMKSVISIAKSQDDLLSALNQSTDKKEEGICFKDPESIYKPNNRRAGWWKMKLEYFEGLLTELDLVIIGGYYGEGRMMGSVNTFLLGVAVAPSDPSATPSEFISFAKVSNGLSRTELDNLLSKLKSHWKTFEKNTKTNGIILGKAKPDVWIEPRKSCILQASELCKSSEFQSDYTLRFPRVEKIRFDKPWYNCMTTLDLTALTSSTRNVEKLDNRHITKEDVKLSPRKKTRKGTTFLLKVPTLEEGQQKSNAFDSKEFYILSGNKDYTVEDLEKKVLEHGGKVVKIDGPNNFCTVVGDITPVVKRFQKNSPRDILKLDWFLRATEGSPSGLLEWKPNDLLNMSKKTKYSMSLCYDKYGDSYTEAINLEELQMSLSRVKDFNEDVILMPQEMNDLDNILEYKNPLGLFRMCFAYFDKQGEESTKLFKNTENYFILFGGVICNSIMYHVTHIVVHSRDLSRKQNLKLELLNKKYKHISIVNENWIPNCIIARNKLNVDMFSV